MSKRKYHPPTFEVSDLVKTLLQVDKTERGELKGYAADAAFIAVHLEDVEADGVGAWTFAIRYLTLPQMRDLVSHLQAQISKYEKAYGETGFNVLDLRKKPN